MEIKLEEYPIQNCHWPYKEQCPRDWSRLEGKREKQMTRVCGKCLKEVTLFETRQLAEEEIGTETPSAFRVPVVDADVAIHVDKWGI